MMITHVLHVGSFQKDNYGAGQIFTMICQCTFSVMPVLENNKGEGVKFSYLFLEITPPFVKFDWFPTSFGYYYERFLGTL